MALLGLVGFYSLDILRTRRRISAAAEAPG